MDQADPTPPLDALFGRPKRKRNQREARTRCLARISRAKFVDNERRAGWKIFFIFYFLARKFGLFVFLFPFVLFCFVSLIVGDLEPR